MEEEDVVAGAALDEAAVLEGAAEVWTSWTLTAAAELVGSAVAEVSLLEAATVGVTWAAGVGVGELKTELQLTLSQSTSFRS